MPTLQDTFLKLPVDLKKAVQLDLCNQALRVWQDYCDQHKTLDYVETVCGTKQVVDQKLPAAAIAAVTAGRDSENVARRYGEPIAAMQDDDLEFPDSVKFAYYSIYNLFGRHVASQSIDDWLNVNQALSAHEEGSDYASILSAAIDRTGNLHAGHQ
ncbi:hypothetical protein [Prosthecobacter sp.]|uniref:hypothetical protein n=1 Tax=Prosthecobacter sp. TaxID=1965333 RepID=UPI0037836D54